VAVGVPVGLAVGVPVGVRVGVAVGVLVAEQLEAHSGLLQQSSASVQPAKPHITSLPYQCTQLPVSHKLVGQPPDAARAS
jgi:hypothetical protein